MTSVDLSYETEDTQYGRYLMFALGSEDYGIKIRYVTEIIGMQPVICMPEMPDFIKGIINLRGHIIPVIDMRLKFKKEPFLYTDRTCIIVIETSDLSAGLIVDSVSEVISIADENISPPLNEKAGIKNRYIQGIGQVGNQVKLLLDCEKLFINDEIQILTEIKKEK